MFIVGSVAHIPVSGIHILDKWFHIVMATICITGILLITLMGILHNTVILYKWFTDSYKSQEEVWIAERD